MMWLQAVGCLLIFLAYSAYVNRHQLRWLLYGLAQPKHVAVPKPVAGHSGALIWLHGVEDSGAGFEWLRKEMVQGRAGAAGQPHVKVILPDAPKRKLTAIGQVRLAWFDKATPVLALSEPDDVANLDKSIALVHALIEEQARLGIAPERIVVGGFAQGAALAVWAAATSPHRLAGVALWSGHAPRAAELPAAWRAGANAATPVIVAHGAEDPWVLPACGEVLAEALVAAGADRRARRVYD